MRTVKELLEAAVRQLNVREDPPESNRVKYNDWYYGRTVMGSAYPWCMAFVQWAFAQAGKVLPYKTASCSALLSWYRQNRPECIVRDPMPGDIILYTFNHTGIVESVQGSTVTAIEGNTSAGSSGSQANGGGVFRRTRDKSLVRAYIRPFGEEMEEDMDIDKLLSEMTDEQAYRLMAKAQAYAAALPDPDWSVKEGHWARATAAGIVNGAAPEGLVKRCEIAAILGRKGLL